MLWAAAKALPAATLPIVACIAAATESVLRQPLSSESRFATPCDILAATPLPRNPSDPRIGPLMKAGSTTRGPNKGAMSAASIARTILNVVERIDVAW